MAKTIVHENRSIDDALRRFNSVPFLEVVPCKNTASVDSTKTKR